MSTFDIILVGGGLANCLIAYRLRAGNPGVRLLLLESSDAIAGNHTWSGQVSDLTADQNSWLSPFVGHRWPGYSVSFRGLTRTIRSPYFSIHSSTVRERVTGALGDAIVTGARVSSMSPTEVCLVDGQRFKARALLDGRGARFSPYLHLGYQKFLGQDVRLTSPHGLDRPVLMDATVPQRGGYRFVYVLPFGQTRLLIEDTCYADTPALDSRSTRAAIADYAHRHGWQIASVDREESGTLPIALGGDLMAHWASLQNGVPAVGLSGGFFHAATGYSLPYAVRIADLIAEAATLETTSLYRLLHAEARALWQGHRFYRMLNRMLFLAAKPAERHVVLRRFYGLPAPLIGRFYAGRSTLADKVRMLAGRPPVPLGKAIRALGAKPPLPESEKVEA